MSLEILIVEVVILILFVMALVWRWLVSWKWPSYRFVSALVGVFAPTIFYLSCREILANLPDEQKLTRFWIGLSAIALAVASMGLAWFALRRDPETAVPRARHWSVWPLVLAAFAMRICGWVSFQELESQAQEMGATVGGSSFLGRFDCTPTHSRISECSRGPGSCRVRARWQLPTFANDGCAILLTVDCDGTS